jgi:adenylate cyclase class IV
MNYKEIELKFSAKGIKLENFHIFCKKRKPEKYFTVSGTDHFYASNNLDIFYRYRDGDDGSQLTYKIKTTKNNSFIRKEYNINLGFNVDPKEVEAYVNEIGFNYAGSIFKNCFIYNYDYYTAVYYIVYNQDMVELDRFIELEMKENYEWVNEQEAWTELLVLEKMFKPLGILPSNRVKESLFEMYRSTK